MPVVKEKVHEVIRRALVDADYAKELAEKAKKAASVGWNPDQTPDPAWEDILKEFAQDPNDLRVMFAPGGGDEETQPADGTGTWSLITVTGTTATTTTPACLTTTTTPVTTITACG